MYSHQTIRITLPILSAGLIFGVCEAQDVERNLAQELTNPIASLYTLPIQLNFDGDLGAGGDGSQEVLNVQPLIPFALNDDWHLISRTIIPFIHQEDVAWKGQDQSGPENVYVLHVKRRERVQLMVFSRGGADVDLHLLASLTCQDIVLAHIDVRRNDSAPGGFRHLGNGPEEHQRPHLRQGKPSSRPWGREVDVRFESLASGSVHGHTPGTDRLSSGPEKAYGSSYYRVIEDTLS